MSDRLHAIEEVANLPEEIHDVVEKDILKQRKDARLNWTEVVTGISGLLDDDLDL